MQSAFATANVPTIYTVFGATGDLARRKLLPSIADLAATDHLPDTFILVGFAGRDLSDEDFRSYVREVLKSHGTSSEIMERLLEHTCYVAGRFEDSMAYHRLAERIIGIEHEVGQCTNKLFHLAVPPVHYDVLLHNLAHSGLTVPCSDATGWTRVLIEKPFGNDLETAKNLDGLLGKLFKEEQIFRIDHYLAKETIQNILTFRFANILLEPVWSRQFIDRVEMTLHETIDVGSRGAFYDATGALKDVGQNHMLQMLALITMDHPGTFASQAIRAERAAVLDRVRLWTDDTLMPIMTRAQYNGYRDATGVDPISTTETFFRLCVEVDNARWRGVPFILEAGKALSKKETAIRIFFKENDPCFQDAIHDGDDRRNVLTFRIQPEEGITMGFFAKVPGMGYTTRRQTFAFDYPVADVALDAYATVIFDCIRGSQTLFASTAEVMATWRFITPILQKWQDVSLESYVSGATADTIGMR